MNEVDKNHRHGDVPASVHHLAFNTCMFFSRHCYTWGWDNGGHGSTTILTNCEGSASQWSPGNIIFASCRSIGCVSRFLVRLAVCFCHVRTISTYCLHIVATLIVSVTNNLKTVDGGDAMHEQQAILSTMVVISHTFCMAKENNLTPRRGWQ